MFTNLPAYPNNFRTLETYILELEFKINVDGYETNKLFT